MSLINIKNSTIITGVTSLGQFLVTEINNKSIGIPLFSFSYSFPSLDFTELIQADLDISNATLFDTATSYGAGIATTVNLSGYAWPIYKLEQNNVDMVLEFTQPTLVSNLTSTGTYVAVKVNGVGYGIPLYSYSTVFPFTSTVAMSSIPITTNVNQKIKTSISDDPSTNLNSKIKTYSQLIDRIKKQLGAPFVNIEVCDDAQICDFIDMSMEWFTKYAGYTEEFLVFSSELYKEPGLQIDKLFSITPTMRQTMSNGASASWDYDLGAYRKVISVFAFEPGESTGINTLFTLEQSMAQQTYFSYMLGNAGFDLVTWECLKGWLKTREKVLAQIYYVDFDQYNQTLRLIPPPNSNSRFYGAVGAWVEKPVAQLISEQWVQKYALALTKIAVGNVRGKYQGMALFGGGVLNYNDLLSQGLKEKDELEQGLQNGTWNDSPPARFFLGILTGLLIPASLFIGNILNSISNFI